MISFAGIIILHYFFKSTALNCRVCSAGKYTVVFRLLFH